jgi:DNA-binding ferritin-like protein (Dps family)
MTARWIGQLTGTFDRKRRYRRYKGRARQLPGPYRSAIEALDRYLTYRGLITNGDVLMSMLDDLLDLFEQSATNGTPVREVVGEDPVEFAETFLRNYSEGQWINKERERLIQAIDRASGALPNGPQPAGGEERR